MRTTIVTVSLFFIAFLVSGEDAAITSVELARHLGIATWRIPKESLPDSYKVTLQHVRSGKLTREYLAGDFKNNGDLLICARWLSESASITVDDGTTIVGTKAFLPGKPAFTVGNHFIKMGSPLLICFVDPEASKILERHRPTIETVATKELSVVENGLAVVISALKP